MSILGYSIVWSEVVLWFTILQQFESNKYPSSSSCFRCQASISPSTQGLASKPGSTYSASSQPPGVRQQPQPFGVVQPPPGVRQPPAPTEPEQPGSPLPSEYLRPTVYCITDTWDMANMYIRQGKLLQKWLAKGHVARTRPGEVFT
jgi:hypothetical protein